MQLRIDLCREADGSVQCYTLVVLLAAVGLHGFVSHFRQHIHWLRGGVVCGGVCVCICMCSSLCLHKISKTTDQKLV